MFIPLLIWTKLFFLPNKNSSPTNGSLIPTNRHSSALSIDNLFLLKLTHLLIQEFHQRPRQPLSSPLLALICSNALVAAPQMMKFACTSIRGGTICNGPLIDFVFLRLSPAHSR